MPVYRIRIIKSDKKGAHYGIIQAPSITSAEHYAVREMILKPRKWEIEDHYKLGVEPIIVLNERSEYKSIFTYKPNFIQKEPDINEVRIILDNSASPLIDYHLYYEETIFELFNEIYLPVTEENEIEFFNKEDLAYFSSVVGKQFSAGDANAHQIKENLVEKGVFAKTAYWAKLLAKTGYTTEFRFDWQHSGRVRSYSWARIYLQEIFNPNVFFTLAWVVKVTLKR